MDIATRNREAVAMRSRKRFCNVLGMTCLRCGATHETEALLARRRRCSEAASRQRLRQPGGSTCDIMQHMPLESPFLVNMAPHAALYGAKRANSGSAGSRFEPLSGSHFLNVRRPHRAFLDCAEQLGGDANGRHHRGRGLTTRHRGGSNLFWPVSVLCCNQASGQDCTARVLGLGTRTM